MFETVFQAVILANILTACVIYGAWRIIRNENDWRGIAWAVVPALIGAFLAYQPPTEAGHSGSATAALAAE